MQLDRSQLNTFRIGLFCVCARVLCAPECLVINSQKQSEQVVVYVGAHDFVAASLQLPLTHSQCVAAVVPSWCDIIIIISSERLLPVWRQVKCNHVNCTVGDLLGRSI